MMHDLNTTTTGTVKAYYDPGRSTLILILGILGVTFLGLFAGLPAWVMGKTDLKKIDAGMIPESERLTTQAGMILGMISSLLYLGTIVFGMFLIVGANVFAG